VAANAMPKRARHHPGSGFAIDAPIAICMCHQPDAGAATPRFTRIATTTSVALVIRRLRSSMPSAYYNSVEESGRARVATFIGSVADRRTLARATGLEICGIGAPRRRARGPLPKLVFPVILSKNQYKIMRFADFDRERAALGDRRAGYADAVLAGVAVH